MRILVAHNVSRSLNGGMSRMMRRIHDRLLDDGHAVDYFCSEDIPPSWRGRAARFGFPILVLRHAMHAARAGRPYDLVNVHEPVGAPVAALRGLAGRPRIVVTSHGVERRGWEVALEEHRLGRDRLAARTRLSYPLTTLWQARLALTRADHVLCLSDEDRAFLVSRFGIAAERITRVYPGGDPVYAEPAAARDYARGDRLLFFGTWLRRKGVQDLATALTALAARHPGLTLTVLGSGFPEAVVRATFPDAVQGRIECPRVTTERDIAGVLARVDVHVLPSVFEGTPQTIVETMLSGMPTVTTATCGMKDVVADGETGLLVPIRSPQAIAEAVDRLAGNRDLRARLGRAAHREATGKYTWERVASAVRGAYAMLGNQRSVALDPGRQGVAPR